MASDCQNEAFFVSCPEGEIMGKYSKQSTNRISEDSEKEHRFWNHFDTGLGTLQGPEVLTILQKGCLGTKK